MLPVGIRRFASFAVVLAGWCACANATAATVELTGVAQLDTRGTHACVVTTAGGVKCWGSNSTGQLGSGPVGSFRLNATEVVGLTSGVASVTTSSGLQALSIGSPGHSCAVMISGGVKCWGSNNAGQLGDGTSTDRPTPVDVQGLPWPAIAVAAGERHTCALSSGGAVACWGWNFRGQLGDGTTTQRLVPTPVTGVSGALAISAAMDHSCAIVPAGAVRCWGYNNNGQLGDGTTTSRSTPADVIGVIGATQLTTTGHSGTSSPWNTDDIAFSASRTCAIVAGVARCWNQQGVVDAGFAAGVTSLSSGLGVNSWYAGGILEVDHTCVVTAAGGVQCSGMNYCGMIGNGSVPSCSFQFAYPRLPPTDVLGISSAISVSAAWFNTCALLATGQVKCWGKGYGGSPATVMEGTSPQEIYAPASTQTIYVGGTYMIDVTPGGSGNPVVFASLTPSTCSVSGNVVTGVGGGICTIAANQAGTAYFDPAPEVTLSYSIDPRRVQTITFGPAPALTVNGVGMVTAVATSGLPVALESGNGDVCTIAGNAVTGWSVGTCQIVARQAGDSSHVAAWESITFPVTAQAGLLGLVAYKYGGGTGTVTSSTPGIDCGASCAANFATSSSVTLHAVAGPGSTFTGWSGACTGMGPCVVWMYALKSVGARFASSTPRLVNLSSRSYIGSGGTAIAGFVIGGVASKRVAIVATGPSLLDFGVPNTVYDPALTLVRSSDQATIASNFDWLVGSPGTLAVSELAALGLAPTNRREAAIVVDLAPGAYTAIVGNTGIIDVGGVAVVGVYEVDAAGVPIINLSTRGHVGSGTDVMIGGFVIEGAGPQTVAIVATGPSLAQYGITGPLANPSLALVRSSDQAVIATNDDWGTAANAAQLQAAGFAPTNPLESAILVTLPPGAYTAILSGVAGGTGVGVIGVYKVN